jgi:hypothetical protein
MFRKKLIKSLALGMCLIALSTGGVVSAAETASEPAQEVLLPRDTKEGSDIEPYAGDSLTVEYSQELVDKQNEIDQFVFKDNADKLAELGFKVTHTGIVGESVEIGIAPYSEEAVNYLYENFGKELIQVVEGINSEIYETTVALAPDTPVSDGGSDSYVGEGVVLEEGEFGITSIDENALDTPVSVDKSGGYVGEDKVFKGGEIETTYDPIIAESSIVKAETKEGPSSLMITLFAGAGVVLLGGIAFFARKLKLR